MCFVLYAGTDQPIPKIEWSSESPTITVKDLTDREHPIVVHFTKPHVQYIGSTSQCGCDFPNIMFQNGGWPWWRDPDDVERERTEQENRENLVSLLRQIEEGSVELYGVWDGNFADAPAAREEVSVEQILGPEFRLKEQCLYLVRISSV